MESIFSSGGALDLHPDGANRLQIPKGWRPKKLFERILVRDGRTNETIGVTPDDSGFGRVRGKGSGRPRGRGGRGRGGSRKRQFGDAFSKELEGLAPNLPFDDDDDDGESEVQYRDDIAPEEDLDDLISYPDGIQGVDDALWTRWGRKTSLLQSRGLSQSGIASGRGDSLSEKAYSLGWGRVPRELASQAVCIAPLISTPPSPSAYAISLCHLYYTHDSNTAQSLLTFLNTTARRYISTLDFRPMMSVDLLGEDLKSDINSLFQPDDTKPWNRLMRALNGIGGGRYRGLFLQHIAFVANEMTELFKDEVKVSSSGVTIKSREGASTRRQNARMFLFETFGFTDTLQFIEGQSKPVNAWIAVLFNLLRAILVASPSVKEFCQKYRMWRLDLLGEETNTLFKSKKNGDVSHNPPLPLVSVESADSAVSLLRILLVITGKPALYFSGTSECDEIADEIANVMTFSTEIILSSIGFGVASSSYELNHSNGGIVEVLAKAAVSSLAVKERAPKENDGPSTWPSRSCINVVRSLFSSPLANLSVNQYCSRLLADLFLSADDARRHLVDVLSEMEIRSTDDGNEKASCVLHRAIECQLDMLLGVSESSVYVKSKLDDRLPQDVSPASLLRLVEESPSCEAFESLVQYETTNINPLQLQLDHFAVWFEKSCREFNLHWKHFDTQSVGAFKSWSNLQLFPNLGGLCRSIGGGSVQAEDVMNKGGKSQRFTILDDVIVEPYDMISDTRPLVDVVSTSLSLSSSTAPNTRPLAYVNSELSLSSSPSSYLQRSAEKMRFMLRSTHRPLSQMISHFILLLSYVAKRLFASLNSHSRALRGVSVDADSLQTFKNRVLMQASSFLRPQLQTTSRVSLSRNLVLRSQLAQGEDDLAKLDDASKFSSSTDKTAANELQELGSISLTSPLSLHFLHSLVNVLSAEIIPLDDVFEAVSYVEPLPFIRAQSIYTFKARVLPVPTSVSVAVPDESFIKTEDSLRRFLLALEKSLLLSPDRQYIQRHYVHLPIDGTTRYQSSSKKKNYTELERSFDESETIRGKKKESMKGDGSSLLKPSQTTEKSVQVTDNQAAKPPGNDVLLNARRDKEKKDETAHKNRYEALTAQREKVSTEESAQKSRYEEIQSIRISSTVHAPLAASSQGHQRPSPPLSKTPAAKGPITSSPPRPSNTSALPLPPKNQSYSAECKSCTFELEYTLNDTTSWICGIPIACRVCDNLVAFCCDDEKCKRINYVTSNLALDPTQTLLCFTCKKPYGSTQEEVNRRSEPTASTLIASSCKASGVSSASSAPVVAPSLSLARAPPSSAPVRIILTMPSLKTKEEVTALPTLSAISSTRLASSTSSPSLLSAVSHRLVVSESDAGRVISGQGRVTQLLEHKSIGGV